RYEDRIVWHKVLPILGLEFHADDLVDLHSDGALIKSLIQMDNRTLHESRTFPVIGIEARAPGSPALAGTESLDRRRLLLVQILVVGIVLIQNANVQYPQV